MMDDYNYGWNFVAKLTELHDGEDVLLSHMLQTIGDAMCGSHEEVCRGVHDACEAWNGRPIDERL